MSPPNSASRRPLRLWDLTLHVVRALGGFAIAQRLTRTRLRILCYHGFSQGDEHEYVPQMFMRAETFKNRLRILKRRGIPVITLEEAVNRLERREIGNSETVITMDDGWASNLTIAVPLLQLYKYPACIYVTTEHLASEREVFNVILYYLLVKSGRSRLHLAGVHDALDGEYELGDDPTVATRKIIASAEKALTIEERYQALAPIAAALGLAIEDVLRNGRFQLLTKAEMAQLSERGISLELHTHTHRLPSDFGGVKREIELNRQALASIIGREPRHFCYPSGFYTAQHPQWLSSLGVVSGTTCDPGLNDPSARVMLLRRFLDSELQSNIAFEAEVSGLRELARNARALLYRLTKHASAS